MTIDTPLPQRQSEHFVRFYHDDGALAADIACYLSRALESGCAIIIATQQRIDAVRRELGVLVPHVADRLVAFDAAAMLAGFMLDGWPDRERFHAVVGSLVRDAAQRHGLVRAYGEMVALLCADGLYDAAVALEELWNELALTCTFSLFCAYKWSLFPSADHVEPFRQICSRHGHACPDLPRHEGAMPAGQPAAPQHVDFVHFLDQAAEGIHSVSPEGTILWANKAELDMLGYSWDEYVGQPIAQFHVDQDAIRSTLERYRQGEAIHSEPASLRCKDGAIRNVLVRSNGCFVNGRLQYTRCFTRAAD